MKQKLLTVGFLVTGNAERNHVKMMLRRITEVMMKVACWFATRPATQVSRSRNFASGNSMTYSRIGSGSSQGPVFQPLLPMSISAFLRLIVALLPNPKKFAALWRSLASNHIGCLAGFTITRQASAFRRILVELGWALRHLASWTQFRHVHVVGGTNG